MDDLRSVMDLRQFSILMLGLPVALRYLKDCLKLRGEDCGQQLCSSSTVSLLITRVKLVYAGDRAWGRERGGGESKSVKPAPIRTRDDHKTHHLPLQVQCMHLQTSLL